LSRPFEIVSISWPPSSPGLGGKIHAFGQALQHAAMQIWFTMLGELARAMCPHQHTGSGIGIDDWLGSLEDRHSPPTITVNLPFSAPA